MIDVRELKDVSVNVTSILRLIGAKSHMNRLTIIQNNIISYHSYFLNKKFFYREFVCLCLTVDSIAKFYDMICYGDLI